MRFLNGETSRHGLIAMLSAMQLRSDIHCRILRIGLAPSPTRSTFFRQLLSSSQPLYVLHWILYNLMQKMSTVFIDLSLKVMYNYTGLEVILFE